MTQIIVHTTENGNVALTIPTGELPINEVLEKDCPNHAIIIDDSELPQGADRLFFDAWELDSNKKITINFSKAQAIKLSQYNANALIEAQKRQLNTLSGVNNSISDADFLAKLNVGRNAIANAKTTDELVNINN